MKKLLIICLLSMIATVPSAQERKHKFLAQLEVGSSIPLGRFAHKSFSGSPGDTSGNAVTGIVGNIVFQYQFAKRFGVSLLIGGSVNKQDEKYLEKEVRKGITNDYILNVEAKSWKVYKVMPGIYYSIPFSPGSKFSFKPMLSAGVCKTSVPGFSYGYHNPNLTGSGGGFSQSKISLPLSFCYQFSATLDYAFSKKFYLLFDANYFNASLTQKYSYFANWPLTGNLSTAKKNYSLNSFNLGFGIGVRF